MKKYISVKSKRVFILGLTIISLLTSFLGQPLITTASLQVQDVEHLLSANPQDSCSEYTYQCIITFSIKILDYLHQNPKTPYRQALLNRLMTDPQLPLWWPLQWLREDWLDETVIKAFNEANGLPEGFKEKWSQWGEFFTTDLDGNADPDYLLTIRLDDFCPQRGEMYWLYRNEKGYHIDSLPVNISDFEPGSVYPTVLALKDLTGDGRPELAYTVYTCGASTGNLRLRVLSWQNNRLKDLVVDEWMTSNGEWAIQDEDGDGLSELIGTDNGSGGAGFGPFLPYELHFKLHRGEYVPVKQVALTDFDTWREKEVDSDILYWQWAQYLLHTGRFKESIAAFQAIAQGQVPSPWVDFKPYALFRIGLLYILLDDVAPAQATWKQLITQYPEHPVGIDIGQFQPLIQKKDDLWKGCAWLHLNGGQWSDSKWAATDQAVRFTKWRFETQEQIDYDKWLGKQGIIDYTKERENLEDIFFPDFYKNYLGWWDVCHPIFLVGLRQWTQQESLEVQMQSLAANWQTLSNEYDLNNDNIADPLGILQVGAQPYLWAFISKDGVYDPLFINQPYPLEGVNIWMGVEYLYGSAIWGHKKLAVVDLDKNGSPEVLSMAQSGFTLWEWVDHRFQRHYAEYYDAQQGRFLKGETSLITESNAATTIKALLFDYDQPNQFIEERLYRFEKGELKLMTPTSISQSRQDPNLTLALKSLFRENNPQAASEFLAAYKPDTLDVNSAQWNKAAVLYFKALTLKYANRPNEAQAIFSQLTQNFASTGWAILAKENLN
ncbi:MAG: tetratricopeptide repeat protein [Anaerolineae bacterium]